jgi:YidC/Oxa1 family membrane protein insertase
MEKSHLILGLGALGLAAALLFREGQQIESEQRLRREPPPMVQEILVPPPPLPAEEDPAAGAGTFFLENDWIGVEVNGRGGAIGSVALKRHPAALQSEKPWQLRGTRPALALALVLDEGTISLENVAFTPLTAGPNFLALQGRLADGTTVLREYRLTSGEGGEPYQIRHRVRIAAATAGSRSLRVTLGELAPGNGDNSLLHFVSYDGKRAHFTPLHAFQSSGGFFGLGRRGERPRIEERRRTAWAALKNQFFTAILTPETPALGTVAERCGSGLALGGFLELPLELAAPGREAVLTMDYYVGPKEYARLEKMGQGQDLVMQFGWFGFIGKILLLLMMGIHLIVPNWGWTIILLTLLVKLALWPLTGAQVRSSRALARLQKPIREIQTRYKNHPNKVREETLRLFREQGVNPAAGCLPILIQIPIFFGLYAMLRSAAELRFAHFLWIADLSAADSVAHLGSFPINPLPLLMASTTFLQMRLAPTPTSSPGQKLLFQAMPFIFLCFAYGLPSGLVLYWTVQNGCSIFQQTLIQRRLAREEKKSVEKFSSGGKKRKKY